jgi:hypothetical protein
MRITWKTSARVSGGVAGALALAAALLVSFLPVTSAAPTGTQISSDGEGGYRAATQAASISFRGKTGDDRLVQATGDGWWLAFSPDGATQARPGRPSGSTISYTKVLPHADLGYEVSTSGLSETITLHSARAGNHLIFPFAVQGLAPVATDDGVSFFGGLDELLVRMPAAIVRDAAGATRVVATTLESSALTLTADLAWLRASDRAYPVTVTRTIEMNASADSAGLPAGSPESDSVSAQLVTEPPPPVAFRASATNDGGVLPALSITIKKPTGVVAGDLMLMHLAITGPGTVGNVLVANPEPPPGWFRWKDTTIANVVRGIVYSKVATIAEPATYTVSFGLPVFVAGAIGAWSNVDNVAPVVAVSEATAPLSSSIGVPGVFVPAGGRAVTLVALLGYPASTPAGTTRRWIRATPEPLDYLKTSAFGFDEPRPVAGTSPTRTSATSLLAAQWIGHQVSLRPHP